ncbi:MAG TPA: type III-A CRISPR-associated RAMP protein Csm3 [Anaerolineales bacterium]|nr:type III-A CRISPR-associated RAMP protein Csm3 [Anaerolineales bacterium]
MADLPKGTITLKGRLFLKFNIEALTGIHIGGAFEGVEIGGVDKTVIRNPINNRPYIPGSSLRGKVRSLVEKYLGKKQNQRINQGYIHSCQDEDRMEYPTCEVCQVFGVPGEREFGTPARLVVRDLHLSDGSADDLDKANTDLPYSEVKVEVAIDRITSQANPRQLERVPAGAIFDKGEMVYSIYEGEFTYEVDQGKPEQGRLDPLLDLSHFEAVLMGLSLLEDDYLGGAGARGSGRIQLKNLRLGFKPGKSEKNSYPADPEWFDTEYASLPELRDAWERIKPDIESRVQE